MKNHTQYKNFKEKKEEKKEAKRRLRSRVECEWSRGRTTEEGRTEGEELQKIYGKRRIEKGVTSLKRTKGRLSGGKKENKSKKLKGKQEEYIQKKPEEEKKKTNGGEKKVRTYGLKEEGGKKKKTLCPEDLEQGKMRSTEQHQGGKTYRERKKSWMKGTKKIIRAGQTRQVKSWVNDPPRDGNFTKRNAKVGNLKPNKSSSQKFTS